MWKLLITGKLANMKYCILLLALIFSDYAMGAGPCWNYRYDSVHTVPVVPVVYAQWNQPNPVYVMEMVQKVRVVNVNIVENVWEYRPMIPQYQWIYSPMPIYGQVPSPWIRFNY